MVAFWKECKMTKQTFDDLIDQINTVSKDVPTASVGGGVPVSAWYA